MHCFDIGDTFCAKSGAIKASHSDGFQFHVEAHKRHGFTRVHMADLHLIGHDVDGHLAQARFRRRVVGGDELQKLCEGH